MKTEYTWLGRNDKIDHHVWGWNTPALITCPDKPSNHPETGYCYVAQNGNYSRITNLWTTAFRLWAVCFSPDWVSTLLNELLHTRKEMGRWVRWHSAGEFFTGLPNAARMLKRFWPNLRYEDPVQKYGLEKPPYGDQVDRIAQVIEGTQNAHIYHFGYTKRSELVGRHFLMTRKYWPSNWVLRYSVDGKASAEEVGKVREAGLPLAVTANLETQACLDHGVEHEFKNLVGEWTKRNGPLKTPFICPCTLDGLKRELLGASALAAKGKSLGPKRGAYGWACREGLLPHSEGSERWLRDVAGIGNGTTDWTCPWCNPHCEVVQEEGLTKREKLESRLGRTMCHSCSRSDVVFAEHGTYIGGKHIVPAYAYNVAKVWKWLCGQLGVGTPMLDLVAMRGDLIAKFLSTPGIISAGEAEGGWSRPKARKGLFPLPNPIGDEPPLAEQVTAESLRAYREMADIGIPQYALAPDEDLETFCEVLRKLQSSRGAVAMRRAAANPELVIYDNPRRKSGIPVAGALRGLPCYVPYPARCLNPRGGGKRTLGVAEMPAERLRVSDKNWHSISYWPVEEIERTFGPVAEFGTQKFTPDHMEVRVRVGSKWIVQAARFRADVFTPGAVWIKAAIDAILTENYDLKRKKWPSFVAPVGEKVMALMPGRRGAPGAIQNFQQTMDALRRLFSKQELRKLDARRFPNGYADLCPLLGQRKRPGKTTRRSREKARRVAANPAGGFGTITLAEAEKRYGDDPDFRALVEDLKRDSVWHKISPDMPVRVVPRQGGLGKVNVIHGKLAEISYDPHKDSEMGKYRMVHPAGDRGDGLPKAKPSEVVYVVTGRRRKDGTWPGYYVMDGGMAMDPSRGMVR